MTEQAVHPLSEAEEPLLDMLGDVPVAAALRAFWVGDMDIYAAHSAEEALALCQRHSAMPNAYDLDDVSPVSAVTLAMTMVEDGGDPCGTLADLLAKAAAPDYLAGYE